MISRRAALSSAVAILAGCRPRASAFPGYAFVANEEGQAVAAVDLSAFRLARQIPLGSSPTSVLASPGRQAIFVMTPLTGFVHEIDPARLAVRRRAHVGRQLAAMRLAPDGSALWVLSSDPQRLVRVPLEHFRADLHIMLPARPAHFDLSPDGQLGAVSYGTEGLAGLLDIPARRARSPVRAGGDMGTIRFRSDGRVVLAADRSRRVVSILDCLSGKVITELTVAVVPENFCFKADGGELFVTGAGMDAVVIINPYRTEVTETFLAGRAPGAMAVSNSPEYLFVTNPPTGDVTIFDVETRRAIAVVAVGLEPRFVTMTPDGQYALILNRRSGTMALIRLAAIVPSRMRGAPLFTTIPVGAKPVSAAVIAL